MEILERDPDNKEINNAYSKVTWIYDFWSRMTEQDAMEVGIEWANIQNGERIIDIGCGTGRLLDQIIPWNPDGSNTGIDLSPAMLQKARMRLADQSGNFTLHEADVLDWQVTNDSFDVIFSFYMVDLLPEEKFDLIAQKLHRLLNTGGKIVFGSFATGTTSAHKFWHQLARYFPKAMTYCRPIEFVPYLERAGFQIIKKEQIIQNTFPSEVILAVK